MGRSFDLMRSNLFEDPNQKGEERVNEYLYGLDSIGFVCVLLTIVIFAVLCGMAIGMAFSDQINGHDVLVDDNDRKIGF